MRTLVFIGLGLLVLAAASALAVSRLLAQDDLEKVLISRTEAIIGQRVVTSGDIDFNLLPRPVLTIGGARVEAREGDAKGLDLAVDRLDLEVRTLPFLRGELEISSVTLIRPHFDVEGGAELVFGMPFALPAVVDGSAAGVRRVSVRDGSAIVDGGVGARALSLERIGFDLVLQENGPYAASGSFTAVDQVFRFETRLGQLEATGRSALQLDLSAVEPGGGALRLTYNGLIEQGDRPRFDGRLTIDGEDLNAGAGVLGRALDRGAPVPPGLDVPFDFEADVSGGPAAIQVRALDLRFADVTGSGSLRLAPGEIAGDLTFERLALGQNRLRTAGPAFAHLLEASAGLEIDLDLALARLEIADGDIRRVRLTASRAAKEERLQIEGARALLPGPTDLSFSGALGAAEERPVFDGQIAAISDDPRRLLAWLGIDAQAVPETKLRRVALTGDVAFGADRLGLDNGELRFDATTVKGSIAYEAAGQGQVAAALDVDRLDLDAYSPEAEAGSWLGLLERIAASTDTALDARIGRIGVQGIRLADVTVDARLVAGQLELLTLSGQGPAAAQAEMSGTVDVATRRFALSGALDAPRPGLLLRQLGRPPPRALTRIAPLAVEASVTGRHDSMDADLAISLNDLDLRLIGEAAVEEPGPRFDFEVRASHPNYARLVQDLRAISVVEQPPPEAPFSLEGRIRREDGVDLGLVGSVGLGTSRVTGEVVLEALEDRSRRPQVRVRLSSAEPELANLMPVFALFGLRPDPTLVAGPVIGNWPRLAIDFGWLRGFDGTFELSGKGGIFNDGTEIAGQVDERRLTVERAQINALRGVLDLGATLDLSQPRPRLDLTLEVEDVDPREVARAVGLPEVLDGPASLSSELTAIGDTPWDLMRSLSGEAKVRVRDGRLLDLPSGPAAQTAVEDGPPLPGPPLDLDLQSLNAALTIERGLATLTRGDLAFAEGTGQLEGLIDLLLWVADLDLTLEGVPDFAVPDAIQAVGRLGQPQVRVLNNDPTRAGTGQEP